MSGPSGRRDKRKGDENRESWSRQVLLSASMPFLRRSCQHTRSNTLPACWKEHPLSAAAVKTNDTTTAVSAQKRYVSKKIEKAQRSLPIPLDT